MKFRAIEIPIDAPRPAPPTPMPIAADRLATRAEIDAVAEASRSTFVACVTLLSWMNALVFVRTTFCATAPAPAIATPAPKPAGDRDRSRDGDRVDRRARDLQDVPPTFVMM